MFNSLTNPQTPEKIADPVRIIKVSTAKKTLKRPTTTNKKRAQPKLLADPPLQLLHKIIRITKRSTQSTIEKPNKIQ